jgi:hypothetical protein
MTPDHTQASSGDGKPAAHDASVAESQFAVHWREGV